MSSIKKVISSQVSRRLFDCPVNLLRLEDNKLYSRTELAGKIIQEISLEDSLGQTPTAHQIASLAADLTKYAILSHRWGQDELTYKRDFSSELKQTSGRLGVQKILNFCEKANEYGCQYVWFDTGCIDKSNNSELDESIRSMYNWYKNADVCIAYLAGTEGRLVVEGEGGGDVDEWFRRGWCLQELLAPRRMKLFDKRWTPLTKRRYDIVREGGLPPAACEEPQADKVLDAISRNTGIPRKYLLAFQPEKMQRVRPVLNWVAKRETTRPEDIVYCLLGLLDVTLNIAYGEGEERAFHRLQAELLKRYDDRSIFVFDGESSARNKLLAPSPKAFTTPLKMVVLPSDTLVFREGKTSPELSMTIWGLHIALVLFKVHQMTRIASICGKSARVYTQQLGQVEFADVGEVDEGEESMYLGVIGHAAVGGGKTVLFGVLLRAGRNTPSRYERIETQPGVVIIPRPKAGSGGLVELREPEMVYVQ